MVPLSGLPQDCVFLENREWVFSFSLIRSGSPQKRFGDSINDYLLLEIPDFCEMPLCQWSYCVPRVCLLPSSLLSGPASCVWF